MTNPKCRTCNGSGLIVEPWIEYFVTMVPCPDSTCRNGSFEVPIYDEEFGGLVAKPKRRAKNEKPQPLFMGE
jgi:hypothetical protein